MIRRVKHTPATLTKSTSKVTVLSSSQSLTRMCFGYDVGAEGLTLCPARGNRAVNSLTPDKLCSIDSYPGYTIVLYTDGSNYLMTSDVPQAEIFDGIPEGNSFSLLSCREDGTPLFVVICKDKIFVRNMLTGEKQIEQFPLSIYGGVMHCGRLFAVDYTNNCKVVWSGLRVSNWSDRLDGAGYIYLNGRLGNIYKLENLGDDILCVREYGFTIIKGLADSRNFRIAPSQESVGLTKKINTGGVLGQKYYFSTEDGLYSFDGTTIKFEYPLGGYLTEIGGVYVLNDGYVYADCVYYGYQCIMRYDEISGTAAYFGMGCSHPFMVEGELYCIFNNAFYKMSKENPDRSRAWRSYPLGGYGRKTLKYLYVDSDETPEVNIACGGVWRKVSGTGKIPVNLSGDDIRIEIYGNVPVRSISAELEERR